MSPHNGVGGIRRGLCRKGGKASLAITTSDCEYCSILVEQKPVKNNKFPTNIFIRDAFKKKNYVARETVPIPSYPPTIEAVSEYLDREYW